MGHIFVHGPTLQGVAILLQPEVVAGQEPLPTPAAVVPGGLVAGHPPLDATPGDAEVECQPGQGPVRTPRQVRPPAGGARLATDFDLPVDPAALLPPLGVSRGPAS